MIRFTAMNRAVVSSSCQRMATLYPTIVRGQIFPKLKSVTRASSSTARQPMPPMPRVLPPSSTSSSAKTAAAATTASTVGTEDAKRRSRRGGVLIGTGWIIMGLLAVDQVLQYMDHQEAKKAVAELKRAEDAERQQFFDAHKDLPVLRPTVVKFEYKMGGTRGLQGVSLGERLEVVEEGVGPNNTYATCRRRDPATGEIVSIGWYPLSFMEDIPKEKPKRPKFLGLF